MLKDRGSKKWTAMMLTEHVELIRKFTKDYYKVPKPKLDKQQVEEYARIIGEAMWFERELRIEYWKDGFIETVEGTINHLDKSTMRLRVFLNDEERMYIPVDCLVCVSGI